MKNYNEINKSVKIEKQTIILLEIINRRESSILKPL